MVAEILLHIGMHKTGTTALQNALSGYDDGRIRHARLAHANHSIPFVTCFSSEPHRYHVWKRLGATAEQVAQERSALRNRLDAELALPRDRLLVVGEEISLLPTAAVNAMLAHLKQQGRQLSVVAYLRDPVGYVTSAFQQQVRGGQSCYTLPRPHYRQRFEKFIHALGPDALGFRAYAPQHFAGQSIVADFAAVAGLPASALADCRANESLPLDAVRLIHLFNRTGPATRSATHLKARSALIRHLGASFSARFTLDPEIAAAAIEADEVAWIEDAARMHFPTPHPAFAATDPAKAEAAVAAMLRAIPPDATERLRSDLTARHIPHGTRDDDTSLLTKLYLDFLALEEQRQALPARSA